MVENDGAARELHPSERDYLETSFDPFDGARPYVKARYEDKNGWGKLNGFLKRAEVPTHVPIGPAPRADPQKSFTKEEQMRVMRERGFEVTENAAGSVTAKRSSKATRG